MKVVDSVLKVLIETVCDDGSIVPIVYNNIKNANLSHGKDGFTDPLKVELRFTANSCTFYMPMDEIDIELKQGQSGYDAIGDYIRRYWDHHCSETVIVSLGVSYDGKKYDFLKEVASPYNYDDVEFLYDWWEGQRFLKLLGIKSVGEVNVTGGVYSDTTK